MRKRHLLMRSVLLTLYCSCNWQQAPLGLQSPPVLDMTG